MRAAVTLRLLLLLGACACSSGCAAHARRDAGTLVAATGAVTSIVGLGVTLGCVPFEDNDDDPSNDSCQDDGLEPNPEVGLPMLGIGIGIALIGAVLYGTGDVLPTPPASSRPASAPESEGDLEHLY